MDVIKAKNECTFLWYIKNYSFCGHENGEGLVSPEFTADCLEGTVWYLELYPRGADDEDTGYISIYLIRTEVDDGPENFQLKYELSILAADGSTFKSDENDYTFLKDDGFGSSKIVEMDELLLRRKTDCLLRDTLCVRCRMWVGEGDIQLVKQITARTRIRIEQISFVHVVEDFCALEPNQQKTVDIPSIAKSDFDSSSESILYFSDDPCHEGNIKVEITSPPTKKVLSKCEVFLLDSSGKAIKCGEVDYRFDAETDDIGKISLSITRQEILENKSEYLPGGKLSLLIECIFSVGIENQMVEKVLHEIPFTALNQISNSNHDEDMYVEKLSKCHGALDDFKELYSNQFLTDVKIKTETKSFPVHKIVLCSRSSVFKSMLTNDMKEKNTECIDIEDLDDDIVQQFLLFLYSDNLENLEWNSTMKLYYAADKYQVEKLKLVCTSYLTRHLSISSASELLLLADKHNDSDLKTVVEDFILKHDDQVFCSDEWGNLIKTNPILVSMTMRLKYMRKL